LSCSVVLCCDVDSALDLEAGCGLKW
jgi:hypothetical protein